MIFSLYQVFEAKGSKPEIILTIVESGYLLVLQGQESLVGRLCSYIFFFGLLFCFSLYCLLWNAQGR